MINKVNPPPQLFLVNSTKSLENDPGSSSGSGLSYEPPRENPSSDEKPSDPESKESPVVSELDKGAMTGVLVELLESKELQQHAPSPGLTTRYQVDQSRTKGLLLNKKVE